MIILPAIDIQNRQCVRLCRGGLRHRSHRGRGSAGNRRSFRRDGCPSGSIWWIWTAPGPGDRVNAGSFPDRGGSKRAAGGARGRDPGSWKRSTITFPHGISRCILGSAALKDPDSCPASRCGLMANGLLSGSTPRDGMVAAEGWLQVSQVSYLGTRPPHGGHRRANAHFYRYRQGRDPVRPQSGAAVEALRRGRSPAASSLLAASGNCGTYEAAAGPWRLYGVDLRQVAVQRHAGALAEAVAAAA